MYKRILQYYLTSPNLIVRNATHQSESLHDNRIFSFKRNMYSLFSFRYEVSKNRHITVLFILQLTEQRPVSRHVYIVTEYSSDNKEWKRKDCENKVPRMHSFPSRVHLAVIVWFHFCFAALQHISGAVSYPNHTVPGPAS